LGRDLRENYVLSFETSRNQEIISKRSQRGYLKIFRGFGMEYIREIDQILAFKTFSTWK